jgi:hypothetical protein
MKEPWRPHVPDYVGTARARRTRQDSGAVRLQNISNRVWGGLTAWIFWVVAVAAGGPLSIYWLDPSLGLTSVLFSLGLAAASILTYLLLARPFVEISESHIRVRNPIRVHVIPTVMISEVTDGMLGVPRIIASGQEFLLVGLEESLSTAFSGGSEERAILEHEIQSVSESAVGSTSGGVIETHRALLDGGMVALLTAWLLHSFTTLLVMLQ